MERHRKTTLRVAFCTFVILDALFALHQMIYSQMPVANAPTSTLVGANRTQQGAAIPYVAIPAGQFYNAAPDIRDSRLRGRRPHPSNQAASLAPGTKGLSRTTHGGADDTNITSSSRKKVPPKYLVQRDLIPSDLAVPFNDSVTLTTHATHEFLQHVPLLCSRWQGPVSVVVYAPGTDYAVALDKIALLRHCGDPCVRANVSWHVMFDKNHAPPRAAMVNGSSSAAFLRSWNGSCNSDAMQREYAKFREAYNLTYPINVLRNVARRRARTRYVLASDVELYPSANVIPRFLNLVAERRRRNAAAAWTPEVYVLPVFEVDDKQQPPLTKRVLVEMLRNKTAVFFHKWTCDRCHKFPKREQWIEFVPSDENHLDIFTTAKRDRTNSFWEPIFIGTNDDPFYKEAFNWEGKRDKMSHSYELCLRGYNFHILDNAFLVHAPGIKTVRASYDMRRTSFVRKNEVRDALMRRHLWRRHPAFAKNC